MATTSQPIREDVAAEVRTRRQAAGLTQAQLARLADCSLAFVGNLEAGYMPRRSPTLARILAVLDDMNDNDPATTRGRVEESAEDGDGRHGT
jgi:predicted transcriptional regulator